MDTLACIVNKYGLNPKQASPIEIPGIGRADLASLFGELGFRRGAEIGTEGGIYAEILCKANPDLALTCVDAWTVYDGYRDHKDQRRLNDKYYEAINRLRDFNVTFIQKFSMEAVKDFEDGSLDFVYIDANHEWPYITQDIYYWSKKVRYGGIVSGHDYYRSRVRDSKCHVTGAVQGYTYSFRIDPWFIAGRNARIVDEYRDTSRSWFWVKA